MHVSVTDALRDDELLPKSVPSEGCGSILLYSRIVRFTTIAIL